MGRGYGMTEHLGRTWRTREALWRKMKPSIHSMRREATPAEDLLWQRLRNRALGHYFRRQHPFGQYVLDFVCWKKRLAVEVDGEIHNATIAQDRARDEFVSSQGFSTLRFTNEQVLKSPETVMEAIRGALHP